VVPLRVGVLGPVTVWCDGREVAAGPPRQLAVLGVLATRANRVVSRGELVDAVWGSEPPATAEGGIYTYVAGLRKILEPDRPARDSERGRRAPARTLASGGGGYVLRLGADGLDAVHFEDCMGRARGRRTAGDLAAAAQAVDEALALWRGLPFAGVPGPFAEAERQRLTELRTTAAEERADLMLQLGQAAEAVPVLTGLVAEHPLRERPRGLLMIALSRCGRLPEALRVFHEARHLLADELGIDPGIELTATHDRLLAMDPAVVGPALTDPPAPRPAWPHAAVPHPAGPHAAAAGEGQAPSRDPAEWAEAPAQLPPEPAGFAGRTAELDWLHALLPVPAAAGASWSACSVALITGTAGVGKTTLAIRFARQGAASFPDGQLYVNLRGFDPASPPLAPGTALQGFFDALRVPPQHVPSTLAAQSALLRTLLDGKRMLLLLDNAHDADQVRPLLPGSPGCMVVVTSRSQLTGLVAAEGARPLALGTLSPVEAVKLLAGRLGSRRVRAEPAAAADLVRHSAGLPLALSVTCALAAMRPAVKLADLAAELADARGRLDALRTGDATTDLRAVFSWSADKLSSPAARMFWLLGLHPGPDISAAAAASLAAVPRARARDALAELTRASLLSENPGGRFGCHDLLRAYCAEQAAATMSAAERDLARRRIADHYLHSAHAAAAVLYPARASVPLPPAADGVLAEEFDAYDSTLSWFNAEQRVLRNVLEQAEAHGLDEHCWKLSWYWAPLLKRRGRLHELRGLQDTALRAAGRLGALDALAHMNYELGHVAGRLGDYDTASRHLRQALALFTELANDSGIGQAQHGIALLLNQQGNFAEALGHALEGLRLRRSVGEAAAIAYSENAVGWILAHLGQPHDGLAHCRRALQLHRDSGSRTGAADTLDSIAYAYGCLADYAQSIAHYAQAIETYRLIGDPQGEAWSLLHLGDIQLASGEPAAAVRSWRQSQALLSQIPGADASEASERLSSAPASTGPAITGPRRADQHETAPSGTVKLQARSLLFRGRASWGRGVDAGHAQPCLAAGEHSPGRDGGPDEGRLSGANDVAGAQRG
jgi:DNA-binding SARP family transcriptional activator/tetratricopeptide (TPR) repeat protein